MSPTSPASLILLFLLARMISPPRFPQLVGAAITLLLLVPIGPLLLFVRAVCHTTHPSGLGDVFAEPYSCTLHYAAFLLLVLVLIGASGNVYFQGRLKAVRLS